MAARRLLDATFVPLPFKLESMHHEVGNTGPCCCRWVAWSERAAGAVAASCCPCCCCWPTLALLAHVAAVRRVAPL